MKLKYQVLTQTTGTVVLLFFQWIISVLLVRLGSFADAGVFALAMSVANVFSFIADCGIRSYFITDKENQFTREQYILARTGMIFVSFTVFGGYLLAEGRTYSATERLAILLYLVYGNVNSFSDIHFGALQVRDKLYVNGFSNMARGVLGACTFLAAYILSHSLLWALGAMALNSFLIFLFYDYGQYRREFPRTAVPSSGDLSSVVRIVKLCLPLMFANVFNFALTATPRRTINVRLGNEALGFFSSMFTPAALISTMGSAVIHAILPKLSDRWYSGDKRGFLKIVCGCYGGAIVFIVIAELFAMIGGRPVVQFIFGEEIMPYYGLLYIAILSYGLSTMSFCGYSVLVSLRKTKTLLIIAITGILFMVCMVGHMVDTAGMTGAAVTLVAAYSIQCLLHICAIAYFVKQELKNKSA